MLFMNEGSMSFWQKLFTAPQQLNEHKNQIACIENDCSCKTDEQLLNALAKATDDDVIIGIKRVLTSRGYSRKELNEITRSPLQ
jgi:hypothetical protein